MAEEKTFEEQIKRYLESKGAWILKTYSNGIQRKGVPDLLVCYKGMFLGLEVKATNGHFVDALQPWNIRNINHAGGIAGVVIPTEGVDRFKRYIARKYPEFIDTPVYDFDDLKEIIEKIESDRND